MANPDFYCAICGRELEDGHKCPEKTLRGIDAANRAALNAEDIDLDNTPVGTTHPWWERLKDGFEAVNHDE